MPVENVGLLFTKLSFLLKPILAAIGVLIAFVFSGDIDKEGKLNINPAMLIKATFGLSSSLTGTPFITQYMGWEQLSGSAEGFLFLIGGVFGLLIAGIGYRAVEMMNGKTLSEIALEIRTAFRAVIKGKL